MVTLTAAAMTMVSACWLHTPRICSAKPEDTVDKPNFPSLDHHVRSLDISSTSRTRIGSRRCTRGAAKSSATPTMSSSSPTVTRMLPIIESRTHVGLLADTSQSQLEALRGPRPVLLARDDLPSERQRQVVAVCHVKQCIQGLSVGMLRLLRGWAARARSFCTANPSVPSDSRGPAYPQEHFATTHP